MATRITKIATPIILAGIFTITVFIAIGYQRLDPLFYIVVLFLVIFVFFFGLATGQSLISPLKKLLSQATELSKGNLYSRVYLETKDELAELADVFNKIAEELQESREQKMSAEKSVGIKVKAKTQELEETINALEQKVKNRTIELERMIKESERLQATVKSREEELEKFKKEMSDLKPKNK